MHRSASQASTYQCCPRKYRYRYLDKLPSKPSEHLAIGSAFDDAMTYIIQNYSSEPKELDTLIKASIEVMRNAARKMLAEDGYDAQIVRQANNVIEHLARLIPFYWKRHLQLEGL